MFESNRYRSKSPAFAGLLLLLPLALLLVSPSLAEDTFGDGPGSGELVSIAEILATPEAFAGEEVRVKGEIVAVCQMAGCWMELVDGEDARLRVKVKDGEIVFPADAVGQEAIARGRLEINEMSRERYIDWRRHLADEQGQSFEESEVGEGPFRQIQIAGVGASIEP